MQLNTLDWSIIAAFFIVSLGIGLYASRNSGDSTKEFFLSGRNMPWWLLGVSMVATTFSADTPNLVTDIVRNNGVAGNWAWWAFLLTGMLTVFVYARLWRRSGVLTDLEFYELRYSGKPARFLRQFRAIYLGVFFNVMIMATVCLAGIKIAGVLLGLNAVTTVLMVSVVTVIYSALGGFKGVVITDFVQFTFAMIGAVWAAVYIVAMPEIGGLDALFAHPVVSGKLDIIPKFDDPAVYVPLLVVPLAVQWWSVWYPGAEPGGGGYVAQRMLAAKNERHAVGATLLFNAFHYALRPWPWILIALASIVVFPDIASLQAAFPDIDPGTVKDDLAYPAMLSYLPSGLLGLVIASLIAALMSTLSTHLNWGSSYIVNDWYQRFIKPEASEKELVNVGRISTVVLMVLSAILALALSNALQAFNILLQIGAGTGLIFILRWFWWRINAWTEVAGMAASFVIALSFLFYKIFAQLPTPDTDPKTFFAGWELSLRNKFVTSPTLPHLEGWEQLLIGVGLTTVIWIAVTFLTRPTDAATLQEFYLKIHPGGPGWGPVAASIPAERTVPLSEPLSLRIAAVFIGAIAIYSVLFATGFYLYGNLTATLISSIFAVGGILFLWYNRAKL
ncbi:sodium:solute symporter family protein [Neolewinella antarctica]|uniref:SSS family transporter n=1 Tax=Neolewinella antarctica TaxID=442734 RepID=A0ABX0XC36_9BACT|nr:sodium:solute symporter family protein [Neolewinella antarctica]NJC26815.1 SSS family transporter [Neolewinella antarctica]